MTALLLTTFSCAHQAPSSVAKDTLALGNVSAEATKSETPQSVCFQIDLKLTGGSQSQAAPSNWTLAWVDGAGKQHPVTLQQRDPASAPAGGQTVTPYGHFEKWQNNFHTCVSKSNSAEIKGLVLTPKELNYAFDKGLELDWK